MFQQSGTERTEARLLTRYRATCLTSWYTNCTVTLILSIKSLGLCELDIKAHLSPPPPQDNPPPVKLMPASRPAGH